MQKLQNTQNKFAIFVGKIVLTLLAIIISWMAIHFVFIVENSSDERYNFAVWASGVIMTLIELLIILVSAGGTFILIGYLWFMKKDE